MSLSQPSENKELSKSLDQEQELLTTFQEIVSFLKDNAHTLIPQLAFSLSAAALLLFMGTPITHATSRLDIASEQFIRQEVTHTYVEQVQKVPESIRQASVKVDIGIHCTGTVIEKNNRSEDLPIFFMITAAHCVQEAEDNGFLRPDRSAVMVGTSLDGQLPASNMDGFSLKGYQLVPGTDIAFIAFQPFSKTPIKFTPIGRSSLSPFDAQAGDELATYTFPHITDGYPVPEVDILTEEIGCKRNKLGRVRCVVPVDKFFTAVGSSGGGFFNYSIGEQPNLSAVVSSIDLGWDGQRDLDVSPISQSTISALDEFIEDFR